MKILHCKEFGPVENLVWENIDSPEPGDDEVLISVKAAALNFPDYLIVQGLYQFKPEFPFAPGNEGAGVIKKIGKNVTKFKEGDRVYFMSAYGAFAEEICMHELGTFAIEEDTSFEMAASYQMAYGTSYHALMQRGELKKDDELLVLGASGGVGLAAVDIAVVIYGEGPNDKEESKALSLELKSKSLKGGFDIIYDPIGDCYTEPAFRSIGWKGRYLVVGFAAGQIPKLPINLSLLKGASLVGVFWGSFTGREPDLNTKNLNEINQMLKDGEIKPLVSKTFPMERAVEAINLIGNRGVIGKVVLTNE